MPSPDLSTQGRALLRVAGRKTGENRWVRAFYKAGSVTVRNVSRVLHVLWLEVTGLFFLALALCWRSRCRAGISSPQLGAGSTGKMLLAATFAAAVCLFRSEFVLAIATAKASNRVQ